MRNLTQYGLQKRDNQTCTDKKGFYLGEGNVTDALHIDCNLENGLSDFGKVQLMGQFEGKC